MSKSSKAAKKQSPPSDNTPYVFQRDKIEFDLTIRELPWTPRQREIINLTLDKNTKMIILKGPSGVSKTALSMYCGLQLLNQKKVSDIVLVRSAVESADNKLGYLPGDLAEKYSVYIAPFNDKLEEFLTRNQIDKLQKDNRLILCPVNYARGLHFAAKFICCDELQNFSVREIATIATRVGEFSKVFMCGDPDQSDINGKSGFNQFYTMFNTSEAREQGIFCLELTEEDIMRSKFCKFIVKTFKAAKI
jgi:phosphate starvation-inducible PhoH-like protein